MAVTQDELYATLDLDLSWSEAELRERERTKHVHRLHPYHGKFIPQLVEVLLGRYFAPGDHVLDPFAGSGTTLVQALESGLDATGVDIAAFNCLLMRVKTASYDLPELGDELRDAFGRIESLGLRRRRLSGYLREWYAPNAAAELLDFGEGVDQRAVRFFDDGATLTSPSLPRQHENIPRDTLQVRELRSCQCRVMQPLHCWQEQADQDCDDGDDHEQLDKREAARANCAFACHDPLL